MLSTRAHCLLALQSALTSECDSKNVLPATALYQRKGVTCSAWKINSFLQLVLEDHTHAVTDKRILLALTLGPAPTWLLCLFSRVQALLWTVHFHVLVESKSAKKRTKHQSDQSCFALSK